MKTPEYIRVLFADDNDDACFMVTTLLAFSNIEVTTARTVSEAWEMAQTGYFDLYLLDSQLPDGSGLELCRILREYAPQMPIVFYSAKAFAIDIENGLLAGANAYLTKPYMDDLAQTVLQIIEHNKKPAFAGLSISIVESQEESCLRDSP